MVQGTHHELVMCVRKFELCGQISKGKGRKSIPDGSQFCLCWMLFFLSFVNHLVVCFRVGGGILFHLFLCVCRFFVTAMFVVTTLYITFGACGYLVSTALTDRLDD